MGEDRDLVGGADLRGWEWGDGVGRRWVAAAASQAKRRARRRGERAERKGVWAG